eukprot:823676-Prymnesium_polylepis.1
MVCRVSSAVSVVYDRARIRSRSRGLACKMHERVMRLVGFAKFGWMADAHTSSPATLRVIMSRHPG